MSKTLQIGSTTFEYPTEGEKPGWGEEATAWAEAVTDALQNVQGPNDILITSATLTNNQITLANIPGLVFNTGQVQSIEVDYLIERIFDSGSTTIAESGKILGNYNGTDFDISQETTGDAGVAISINNSGQFQYTSDDKANHISTTIRFKASTIDQP